MSPGHPRPGETVTINLDRHDTPRKVVVRRVYIDREEIEVAYPGSSIGPLFDDITEVVSVDAIED